MTYLRNPFEKSIGFIASRSETLASAIPLFDGRTGDYPSDDEAVGLVHIGGIRNILGLVSAV